MKPAEFLKQNKTALVVSLLLVLAVVGFFVLQNQQARDYREEVTSTIFVPLPQAWLDAQMKDLGPLLTSSRVVPYLDRENIKGYQVVSIDPESPVETLELQPNDIVMQVEDVRLNGPEQGLQAMKAFQGKSEVFVVIERDGKLIGLSYKIVP